MIRPKAVIIGGGVAGLTAAHELQERGFSVTVYECNKSPHDVRRPDVALGGKARSFPVHPAHAFGWNKECDGKNIVGLPSEHGFRFFPGFYRHLIDTLRRIPVGRGRYVFDNLVDIEHAAYAQVDRAFFRFTTSRPGSLREMWKALRRVFTQNPSLGLTPAEAAFAATKLVNAMTMCDERREAELEHVGWAEYMQAREMSDQYRTVAVRGLTQNFVAMDSEIASTKTAITIIARLLNDLTTLGRTADRVLNGPTSDVWFNHWKSYLEMKNATDIHGRVGEQRRRDQEPVRFINAKVNSLVFCSHSNRVTGLKTDGTPEPEQGRQEDDQSYYILAVPAEAAAKILAETAVRDPEIFEHSPSLKTIKDLQVSWMVGLNFYLKNDVEMCPGHIAYLNSPWAITSISPNQFWRKKMVKYANDPELFVGNKPFDRDVQGVLSVILSDWDEPGTRNHLQTARQCDYVFEVAQEAMWQIREHLRRIRDKDSPKGDRQRSEDDRQFCDDNIVAFSLDPAIIFKEAPQQMSAGEVVQRLADANEARRSRLSQKAQEPDAPKWNDLRRAINEEMNPIVDPNAVNPIDETAAIRHVAASEAIKQILELVFPSGFEDAMLERLIKSFMRSAAAPQTVQDLIHAETSRDLRHKLVALLAALAPPENTEPVFINTVGSAAARPTAVTGIENLFLASDYVKTKTDLATMEAANEAARRAVNGILQSQQSKRTPCAVFSFEEPAVFAPFNTNPHND
jgi:uncharacterized protein with NAD-binding domain and iron-sulfur cluster